MRPLDKPWLVDNSLYWIELNWIELNSQIFGKQEEVTRGYYNRLGAMVFMLSVSPSQQLWTGKGAKQDQEIAKSMSTYQEL